MAQLLYKLALMVENAFYERWLRLSTRGTYGFTPGDWSRRERTYYVTVPYRAIFRIMDSLALDGSDIVVDLGCGKGRAVCCAARYDVSHVIGVEIMEELSDIAADNLRRMRHKRAQSTIVHASAEDFEFTMGTVFYMFHPFGPDTMRSVLLRLKSGLREKPRDVRVVYVNPIHELVFEEMEWLERYQRWPSDRTLRLLPYAVSFWRTRSDLDVSKFGTCPVRSVDCG